MHMGVAFLNLLAIGALLSPELRANPWTWVICGLIFLGTAGLLYNWWLGIRSREAMIDLERRTRR